MSEHLSQGPERAVEIPKGGQAERPTHAEYSAAEQSQQIERAQLAVAAEASSTEQPKLPSLGPVDDRPQLIDNAIKNLRLRRNLKQVQNTLKPAQKSFSKVIHQPLVQLVSENTAKTVLRPSGLLGGGVAAFVGSSVYLYLARHAGFPYNYAFFILFFVSGLLLGLLGEYVFYQLRKLRR